MTLKGFGEAVRAWQVLGASAVESRFDAQHEIALTPLVGREEELDLLRRLCEREGRDYDAIEKTALFGFDVGGDRAKVGKLKGQLRWLAGMGIQTVIGGMKDVERLESLEIMGREVIPAAEEL